MNDFLEHRIIINLIKTETNQRGGKSEAELLKWLYFLVLVVGEMAIYKREGLVQ